MKPIRIFRTLTPLTIKSEGALTPMRRLAVSLDRFIEADEKFAQWIAHEPTGSQWETVGLCPAFGTEYVRDIQGSGLIMFLQFSKRMLPARVINERVVKMAEEIEAATGRKPGRKECRSLRDDAEAELLPRAFVNNTVVPVIITSRGDLFIFSATSSRVDNTISFLLKFLMDWGIESSIHHPDAKVPVQAYMTSLAIDLERDTDVFSTTDFVVMRGDESETIRVSGRDVGSDEVQSAIQHGFRVSEIGMTHNASGISFRLDQKFVLRQVTFSQQMLVDISENTDGGAEAEFDGLAWLAITEYRNIVNDLIAEMDRDFDGDTADDDDEL